MQVFDVDECHFVQYKPPGTGTGRARVMNAQAVVPARVHREDRAWWAQPKAKAQMPE